MREVNLTSNGTGRRKFLRFSAAAVSALAVPQTVSGESGQNPVGIKGNRRRPVKRKHVENARSEVIGAAEKNLLQNGGMVSGNPIPERGYLAGYAISMENGAPVEVIHTVSEPQPITELARISEEDPKGKRPRDLNRSKDARSRASGSDADQLETLASDAVGESPKAVRDRQETRAHRTVERFLAEQGGR